MSATDYVFDRRDQNFVLFEQLGIQDFSKFEKFAEYDQDAFEAMLDQALQIAQESWFPVNKDGDIEGAQWNDKVVTTPKGFKKAWEDYAENGFIGASIDEELGGLGLPASMVTAIGDIFTASNCSMALYPMLGVGVSHVLEHVKDFKYRELAIGKIISGEWSGTMVLTEPGAGTDLATVKAKAEKVEGTDYYHISGEKIFITAGDQDLTENICHLVLAKTPGAPAGVKGISLFYVPKFEHDEEGNLGEANDVYCSRIEHKMGIHGSATCQLVFGENSKCKGWMVGKEFEGIRNMFIMMNNARLEVGLQGVSLMNAAYQNALSYAQERIQGPSVKEFKNPEAPRVAIYEHPDIRRELWTMKAFGESGRALLYLTAKYDDMARNVEDKDEARKYKGYVDLLIPICKAYCTDRGFEMTSKGMQVLGGYGYTNEYPLEQYCRDVRIGLTYEGANGIQAMDFLARKLGMGGGAVFMSYCGEIDKTIAKVNEIEALKDSAKVLSDAKEKVVGAVMTLGGWGAQGRLDEATFRAYDIMTAFGDLVMGQLLADQAAIASVKYNKILADNNVDADGEAAFRAKSSEAGFYYRKINNFTFFAKNFVPRISSTVEAILSEDKSGLEELV